MPTIAPFRKKDFFQKVKSFIGVESYESIPTKNAWDIRKIGPFVAPDKIAFDVMKVLVGTVDNSFYGPLSSAYDKYGGTALVLASARKNKRAAPNAEITSNSYIITDTIVPYVVAYRMFELGKAMSYVGAMKAKAKQAFLKILELLASEEAQMALAKLASEAQQLLLSSSNVAQKVIVVNIPHMSHRAYPVALGLANDPQAVSLAARLDELYADPEVRYSTITVLPKSSGRNIIEKTGLDILATVFSVGGANNSNVITIVQMPTGNRQEFIVFLAPSMTRGMFFTSASRNILSYETRESTVNPLGMSQTTSPLLFGLPDIDPYIEIYVYSDYIECLYMYELKGASGQTGQTGGSSGGSSAGSGTSTGSSGSGSGTGISTGSGTSGSVSPGSTFIASDWAWCVTRFPNDPARQQQCLLELQGKTEQAITKPALIGSGMGLGTFLLLAMMAGGIYYFVFRR